MLTLPSVVVAGGGGGDGGSDGGCIECMPEVALET